MRVLGVDPGTRACGWGLVSSEGRRLRAVAHGVVRLNGSLADRLACLADALDEILLEHAPEVVAVEGVFSHRNARSALILGHARGVVLAGVARAHLPVHEYAPATVKRTVAGSGRATKEAVEIMARRLLGLSGPLATDAADALAIAVCHLQHQEGAPPGRARPAVHDFRRRG